MGPKAKTPATKKTPKTATKTPKSAKKTDKKPPTDELAQKLEDVFNDPAADAYDEAVNDEAENMDPMSEDERADDVESDDEKSPPKSKRQLAKARQQEKTDAANRTIFVGNLPVNTKKKHLIAFFKAFGAVDSVRIRNIMRVDTSKPFRASAIKKQLHPQSRSVNAYVVFAEEKSAHKAVEKNGFLFEGNHIRVDMADGQKKTNKKCSVFVGNVPFDCSEEQLRKHFSECGEIVNVRVIRDRVTRVGKGIAYVEFESESEVPLALQLNGKRFRSKDLRVQRCEDKSAKGGKKSTPAKVEKKVVKKQSPKPSPKQTVKARTLRKPAQKTPKK